MNSDSNRPMAILLAAGSARRYGADKLTQPLPNGEWIAVRACRNLLAAVGRVFAVVRPDSSLTSPLRELGAEVAEFEDADEGMGASLAFGVAASLPAAGWIVALADMPWITPDTISIVMNDLKAHGGIVAPTYQSRRGHPVAFAREFGHELANLTGDRGARSVIEAHLDRLRLLECQDPGVLRDIDTPADLA